MLCPLKPWCCTEAIRQTNMISWAETAAIGLLAFIASTGITVTVVKELKHSNLFISVWNYSLLWDLEHLASKDLSIVCHGHPHTSYFLILMGLEGSEPTLDSGEVECIQTQAEAKWSSHWSTYCFWDWLASFSIFIIQNHKMPIRFVLCLFSIQGFACQTFSFSDYLTTCLVKTWSQQASNTTHQTSAYSVLESEFWVTLFQVKFLWFRDRC